MLPSLGKPMMQVTADGIHRYAKMAEEGKLSSFRLCSTQAGAEYVAINLKGDTLILEDAVHVLGIYTFDELDLLAEHYNKLSAEIQEKW